MGARSPRWRGAVLAAAFVWSTTVPVRAAFLGDGPINTGQPCVGTNRYTRTDSLIFHTGLMQRTNTGSPWFDFNCFYYMMTWILGQLPPGILANPQQIKQVAFGPQSGFIWGNHQVAGNAYFDRHWLFQHGYKQQFVTQSIAGGPVGVPGGNPNIRQGFKPGDVILVPGSIPSWNLQSYVHVGVVTQTDGDGHVIMTRQKVNDWTCTQDLTPDVFDTVYGGGGTIFEVWRLSQPISNRPPQNIPPNCIGFLNGSRTINGPVGRCEMRCMYEMCLRNGGLAASPEYNQCGPRCQ
jgi:hypothetical protein